MTARMPGRRTRGRLAALTAVVGAAAAVAAAVRRRSHAVAPPAHPTYRCGCGREYEHHGQGAHTIYWPAGGRPADALQEDPCPGCGAPLPGRATTAATV